MLTEKQLWERQADLEASIKHIQDMEVISDKVAIVLIVLTFIGVLIFPILSALC